ncbi:CopD family protein [Ornithinimicrobium faecis]|uniref:CopD family protein n=1 Tax=Ornithinimicrobium faecis TaxID=2934158 RepID=A0ABY4YVA9_9MICO|nr:CopD family protein [Ornithinimicrobium sp. HY1793]USQ80494.1 CopD family protein [Ornithinimicrobium sp. HY1793]
MTSAVPLGQAKLRLVAVLSCLVVLLLGMVPAASAHATLIGSDPTEGAVLDVAPERITFTFNESVIGVPSGTTVFDATGAEVASTSTVTGSQLFVDLGEEVGEGTLVVVWRLVSRDGHPIGGSLRFSVGGPSDVVDIPGAAAADVDAQPPVLLTAMRWLGYLGLLVGAGVAAFSVLFLPRERAADAARGRLRRLVRAAVVVAAVGWWAAVPLVAIYQLGVPASALADASTWAALAAWEYAVPSAVVVGLALAAAQVPSAAAPGRRRAALVLAACALALAAPALTGHTRAASPEVLAIGADVLHLVAAAVWLGGLVSIVLVLGDLAARGDSGAVVIARFSAGAAWVLAVLVVVGLLQAWWIAGSVQALMDTSYGTVLLIKVIVALVAVAIGAWNRRVLLPRLRAATQRKDRQASASALVRATAAEAAILVVVLLVTAVLVDRSPQAELTAASEDQSSEVRQSVQLEAIAADIVLAPAAVGPNTLTIEMTDASGAPAEGYETPRLSVSSPAVNLGEVVVRSRAPGVYSGDIVLPTNGEWTVHVSLRTSEFDNPVRTVQITVP